MDPQATGRIILIDPQLCTECRFAVINDSVEDGQRRRTITCRRLDCDNWQRLGTVEGEQLLLRKLLDRLI